MKKKTKLTLCDRSLLALTVAILASGLQLEINPFGKLIWVWTHIILGTLFLLGIVWHVSLHHRPAARVGGPGHMPHHHGKHPALGIFFLLTLLSGIIATCHWVDTCVHSIIGGIHGKIGFLFLIAVVAHVWKNRRFYLR